MKETIFTKIAKREIPAYIIHENEEFIAILDIYPAVYGQTLVIPKQWHDSYVFNNENDVIHRLMDYAKSIASMLDQRLGSERCRVLFEGYGIDHLHAKLYPSFQNEQGIEEFDPRKISDLQEEKAKEILKKLSI